MYQIESFYLYIKETLDDTVNRYAVNVAEGRKHYFDEIDKHIRPGVIRQTYKYQLTPEDRNDFVQELMETAFKNCSRYDPSLGDYRRYIYRSTKYELMKMYYKKLRDTNVFLTKHEEGISFSVADYKMRGICNPLDIIVFEEGESYLLNDDGPCTKLERRVYNEYHRGYKIKEIGSRMGMSEKNVRNTLYRARVKAMRVHSEEIQSGI